MPKEYGEATNLPKDEKRKKLIVGEVEPGKDIVLVDDVFTTGDAKYEAKQLLDELLDRPKYAALAIAVDRQEVGIDGESAISKFEETTGIPVISIITTSDIYNYLMEKDSVREEHNIKKEDVERIATYLRVYGTEHAKVHIKYSSFTVSRGFGQRVIQREKSVVPACDVRTLEEFEELVKQTSDVDGIGGYKVGFELGLGYGLKTVVDAARKHTVKPIIYDHQKAGTDIPDTGKNFARVCKDAGVNAAIIFPQSGPETERAWIYHLLDNGMEPIVGGIMTHPAYLQSEGGFINDKGAFDMYRIAADAGISNFVVPGNKPDIISRVKDIVMEGRPWMSPSFFAPGLVAQGGRIEDAAEAAGDSWHAIIGRGIYQAEDMRKAAIEHTSQL